MNAFWTERGLVGVLNKGKSMTTDELWQEYLKTVNWSYSERANWPTIQEAFKAGIEAQRKLDKETKDFINKVENQ